MLAGRGFDTASVCRVFARRELKKMMARIIEGGTLIKLPSDNKGFWRI